MRILSGVSGTSCDGIAWTLAEITEADGKINFRSLKTGNSAYSPGLKNSLLHAANTGKANLADLCDMHWSIGQHFARLGKRLGEKPDAAVFSGHTMYHTEQIAKTGKGTFQIGAIEPLSIALKIPVMSDLRYTDVAAGGMGAPLVPRGDEIMFNPGSAVLNMGGIANVTLLGKRTTGFDTGPSNMLIDEAVRVLFGRNMDTGGRIAFSGKADEKLLSWLMEDDFVNASPPKSCGRERYGSAFFKRVLTRARSRRISSKDIVTTLSEFTARSISRNLELFAPDYRTLICAGGGAFNRFLVRRLRELFPGSVHISDEFGVPRGSRESLAFAILCYLSLKLEASNSDATGAKIKVPLGKVTAFGFERQLLSAIAKP